MEIKFTKDENPRYTMFRAAMGDREVPFYKFSLWVQARWRDYAKHLGVWEKPGPDAYAKIIMAQEVGSKLDTHKEFDTWLKTEVENGRFTEEP